MAFQLNKCRRYKENRSLISFSVKIANLNIASTATESLKCKIFPYFLTISHCDLILEYYAGGGDSATNMTIVLETSLIPTRAFKEITWKTYSKNCVIK